MVQYASGYALARRIFSFNLSRADGDLDAVSDSDIEAFITSLQAFIAAARHPDSALDDCIIFTFDHILSSRSRTSALVSFMAKLADLIEADAKVAPTTRQHDANGTVNATLASWYTRDDLPSAADVALTKARMNLLYFYDALCRGQAAAQDADSIALDAIDDLPSQIVPGLGQAIAKAASSTSKYGLDVHIQIKALLDGWQARQVFTPLEHLKLRQPARDAYFCWLSSIRESDNTIEERLKVVTAPDVDVTELPSLHGSQSLDWCHLPAANMLPLLQKSRTVDVRSLRPHKLPAGPLDPELAKAVDDYVTVWELIADGTFVGKRNDKPSKLTGMGFHYDVLPSGDRQPSETYYGWSAGFIRQIKGQHVSKDGRRRDESSTGAKKSTQGHTKSSGDPKQRYRLVPPPQLFGEIRQPFTDSVTPDKEPIEAETVARQQSPRPADRPIDRRSSVNGPPILNNVPLPPPSISPPAPFPQGIAPPTFPAGFPGVPPPPPFHPGGPIPPPPFMNMNMPNLPFPPPLVNGMPVPPPFIGRPPDQAFSPPLPMPDRKQYQDHRGHGSSSPDQRPSYQRNNSSNSGHARDVDRAYRGRHNHR